MTFFLEEMFWENRIFFKMPTSWHNFMHRLPLVGVTDPWHFDTDLAWREAILVLSS